MGIFGRAAACAVHRGVVIEKFPVISALAQLIALEVKKCHSVRSGSLRIHGRVCHLVLPGKADIVRAVCLLHCVGPCISNLVPGKARIEHSPQNRLLLIEMEECTHVVHAVYRIGPGIIPLVNHLHGIRGSRLPGLLLGLLGILSLP